MTRPWNISLTIGVLSAALLVLVSSASATILTDGSGQLKTGAAVTAEAEGKTILHPPIGSIECNKAHFGGKTSNDGGAGVNVNVNVETLSWSECAGTTVAVLKKGTLSIAWTSGNNGTLYSTGTEVTTVYLGFHCIFGTNNTQLGTITGSATTKGAATLDINATIPRTAGSSGSFCGASAAWTGAYKFTSPSTMNLDSAPPPTTTVLRDGLGNQLKTGAAITAESEVKSVLHPPIGSIECENSHFGGKTTNDGGLNTKVEINVESLTWSKCKSTVTVLAKGTLSIEATSGNNGVLYSTGTEITVEHLGFHCIFKTSNTKLGTITGSATTKGSATLDVEATIPRTGGGSGNFCGSTAQWTGAYKFTSPSTLNIFNTEESPSTVLTDGSGAQLKTGASITAEDEIAGALHPPIGSIECENSHFGGKTSNDGGGGASVDINVEDFTWSKCNAALTVLARGTLAITATSGGDGTLTSTGTELTVSYEGFHCVFKTSNTKLGTITGSTTTKGAATLDIEATIPRTAGGSGALCGSTASWTGSYKFTAPSALNID